MERLILINDCTYFTRRNTIESIIVTGTTACQKQQQIDYIIIIIIYILYNLSKYNDINNEYTTVYSIIINIYVYLLQQHYEGSWDKGPSTPTIDHNVIQTEESPHDSKLIQRKDSVVLVGKITRGGNRSNGSNGYRVVVVAPWGAVDRGITAVVRSIMIIVVIFIFYVQFMVGITL